MVIDGRRPLHVLVFSSGNPAATFLAAGLLYGHPAEVDTVLIQGIEVMTPEPEVARVLGEMGLDVEHWVPTILKTPPAEPVDVGLTICVPT